MRNDEGIRHLTTDEIEGGLDHIRQSPADNGRILLIVRRPAVDERETPAEVLLDCTEGLIGDTWSIRASKRTPDGSASLDAQITIMNARAAALIAGSDERWKLAGDQFYADLDISHGNLPAGSHVQLGSAVVEISEHPHTGCEKFVARFGKDAMRFVNSPGGRDLRLRGVNTRVVVPGAVLVGDAITKVRLP